MRTRLVVGICLGFALLSSGGVASAVDAPTVANLEAGPPLVTHLRPDAPENTLETGELRPLRAGDGVAVSTEGIAWLRFYDSLVVKIFHDTELRVVASGTAAPAPGIPLISSVRLRAGAIFANRDPTSQVQRHVQITTPNGVTIQSFGTEFLAYYNPETDLAWVVVKEGLARVTAADVEVDVLPWSQTWVRADQPPNPVQPATREAVGDLVPSLETLTNGEFTDEYVLPPTRPSDPAYQPLPVEPSRLLLAYYYTWWDPPIFSRTRYHPPSPYNSDDVDVMRQHVQQAQAAGIDGFIVSWWGNGDRTDNNLAKLMDVTQQAGLQVTIHFETTHFDDAEDVVAQLQAFYTRRINHPAMLKRQGRPVIFFWHSRSYDNSTWSAIRARVDPSHRALWIADGGNRQEFTIVSGDAWDGISPYAIAWSTNPARQLPAWATQVREIVHDKLWIPPVSPGCDDVNAELQDREPCKQVRSPEYYESTFAGALASKPDWAVIVNTFNEWIEGTEIERSAPNEYGNLYLQLTRQFADRFKGQADGLGERRN